LVLELVTPAHNNCTELQMSYYKPTNQNKFVFILDTERALYRVWHGGLLFKIKYQLKDTQYKVVQLYLAWLCQDAAIAAFTTAGEFGHLHAASEAEVSLWATIAEYQGFDIKILKMFHLEPSPSSLKVIRNHS
jgi:hypothetical protein